MVDREYIASQLKGIGFANSRINRAEIRELENILLPDETIYECVNGYYEGGVALLVATDIRVLLIDKKPMGFLNVDDLRFDMIGDIDYSHRIIGAQININCGMRNLIFKSYNQPRLRKAIGHIQQRMSEIKKEQAQHANEQRNHLEEINHQLQIYLLAQQQHLEQQLSTNQDVQLPKPSPKLADYLFAQRLLEDFQNRGVDPDNPKVQAPSPVPQVDVEFVPFDHSDPKLIEEMAEEGRREVLGETKQATANEPSMPLQSSIQGGINGTSYNFDLTPFRIAYAKLPYLLRSRRYRHQS
jgi:hypothetical protein